MKPILVLGLGNRLMMDDGLGVELVEALMLKSPMDSQIEYAVGETDLDYCLDVVENREYIIVIDAVVTGKQPGEVSMLPLSEMVPNKPGLSLHHLHFIDLLHQVEHQKKGVLIGVEPFTIDFHWGVSECMHGRLPLLIEEVRRIISYLRKDFLCKKM
ncbi:hydrogenase maturation protease [Aneurinibacillus sp. REN35]|uniref:hydrogenase maturation protease n=1 Tax=Aneurinibacillus sp. REN35 TaxID=3237286 RepID=UPI0035287841